MESTKVQIFTKMSKKQLKYGLFALVLGLAPFGSFLPLGCAFLLAVPKKGRLFAFLGALIAALFDASPILALFCVAFCFFVLTAREKDKGATLQTRLLLALAVGALRASYVAVLGIKERSDILSLLVAVSAVPIFCYCFSGYFDKRKEIRPKRYDASLLAFAFAFTILFSRLSVFGVTLALVPATAFTLCSARTRGFAFGGACGVLCGFVCGGSATGALGVLGMTYGLLATELEPLALCLSLMLALSGYFYLSGTSGLLVVAIMMLIVYVAFVPMRKHLPIHKSAVESKEKRAHDRRLSRYAAAFSSLSSLFYTVSAQTREQSITELNQKIVDAVNYRCEHCSGCQLDKSEISNFFTSEIRRNGVASFSKIPQHITAACPNVCMIARDINNLEPLRQREGEKGLKQMADEYSAFSAVLIDAAKKQEDSTKTDKSLADNVKKALLSIGVTCDGVKVVGTRIFEVTAFGVNPDKIKASATDISNAVGELLGVSVSTPEIIFHDDYALMKFNAIPSLRVEFAKFSEAKNGETVCGDTVSVFENDEKYFYCLVSDGMGSGRDAALTSKLSAIMLEKLLTVGAEKENALKLLNRALTEKEEEIFATVDLLEIDRINSVATLLKAGAAPTIVIRNGKSVKIESRTPPAGIMKNVIADKKVFRLEKGDMIVMLSDGVLQTGNDMLLLPERGLPPMPSARALASSILREARNQSETADDMSVCVLRIY